MEIGGNHRKRVDKRSIHGLSGNDMAGSFSHEPSPSFDSLKHRRRDFSSFAALLYVSDARRRVKRDTTSVLQFTTFNLSYIQLI